MVSKCRRRGNDTNGVAPGSLRRGMNCGVQRHGVEAAIDIHVRIVTDSDSRGSRKYGMRNSTERMPALCTRPSKMELCRSFRLIMIRRSYSSYNVVAATFSSSSCRDACTPSSLLLGPTPTEAASPVSPSVAIAAETFVDGLGVTPSGPSQPGNGFLSEAVSTREKN